ncbi:LiaI-LiaF-like domain-containing protein [Ottowia thiooxydans]|uniref:LiaI-LiaF-like domain-containing protein n=1 Tax=Ottowia thiooxydans TaxID=219182 RepID=UPI000413C6E4|nr:DUF5668 domain-containing protein [Ottowia thiooxydans]
MRIFPFALIAIGVFGVLKHFGFIDPAFVQLFWPLILIGIGIAMLARGPRWRADMRERMQDRWERRMNRQFGPGWTNLSEEERNRFRAGMRQWHSHGGPAGHSHFPASTKETSSSKQFAQPPTS